MAPANQAISCAKRIEALLRHTYLTQAEIARRVGCSREWVRQVGNKLGITGKNRRDVGALDRLEREIQNIPFVKAARERGLLVQPVTKYIPGNASRRFILVNRRLCWLSNAWPAANTPYFRFSGLPPTGRECAFQICDLRTGEFLIIPADESPRKMTMFAPELTPSAKQSGVGIRGRNWRNYMGAWHLLATKRRKQLVVS